MFFKVNLSYFLNKYKFTFIISIKELHKRNKDGFLTVHFKKLCPWYIKVSFFLSSSGSLVRGFFKLSFKYLSEGDKSPLLQFFCKVTVLFLWSSSSFNYIILAPINTPWLHYLVFLKVIMFKSLFQFSISFIN